MKPPRIGASHCGQPRDQSSSFPQFTGSDDGSLKAWTAPDFTWDRRPQPTQSEYRPDGTLIETFPDGSVKTSKKH